jgi:hypothetical protein
MDGFDIVLVITIILFARLGVRLVSKYFELKNEEKEKNDDGEE